MKQPEDQIVVPATRRKQDAENRNPKIHTHPRPAASDRPPPPQDTHPTPDRRQQQALVTRRYDRICQMLQPAEYTIAEMRPQPRLPATHVSANNAKGRGTHVDPAANSLCCTPSETNPGYRSASGPCQSGYSPSRADSIGCSGSRLTGRVFGLNGNFSARIFS